MPEDNMTAIGRAVTFGNWKAAFELMVAELERIRTDTKLLKEASALLLRDIQQVKQEVRTEGVKRALAANMTNRQR